MSETIDEPQGQLVLRTLAMPADMNPNGDIFGGWLLSQMDIAGGLAAKQHSRGRVVTIAINAMTFINRYSSGTSSVVMPLSSGLGIPR